MKQKKLFLLMLIIFVINSAVLAQEERPFQDVISEVLDPIAGRGFDLAEIYGKYGMFIDFVIYLVLFIGIAQATLMKHFEGTGGKTVVVVVGIMLAVGLTVWAHQEVDGKPRF